MTNVNENSERATIVDGVVLTNEALKTLGDFQEQDNFWLKALGEELSNTVCFLAKKMDDYTTGRDEAVRLMSVLGQLRDEIKTLRKP